MNPDDRAAVVAAANQTGDRGVADQIQKALQLVRAAGGMTSERAMLALATLAAEAPHKQPPGRICVIGPPAGSLFSPEALAALAPSVEEIGREHGVQFLLCNGPEHAPRALAQLRQVIAEGGLFTDEVIDMRGEALTPENVLRAFSAEPFDWAAEACERDARIADLVARLSADPSNRPPNRATRRAAGERRAAKQARKTQKASRRRNRR